MTSCLLRPEDFGAFVKYLRSQNQHYIPIIDAAFATTYNDSDVYDTYTRGAELDVWLKNPDGSEYRGRVWPGVTVFPDFSAPNSEQFWYEAYKNLSDVIPFSGIWEDMNEPSKCQLAQDLSNLYWFTTYPPYRLLL